MGSQGVSVCAAFPLFRFLGRGINFYSFGTVYALRPPATFIRVIPVEFLQQLPLAALRAYFTKASLLVDILRHMPSLAMR